MPPLSRRVIRTRHHKESAVFTFSGLFFGGFGILGVIAILLDARDDRRALPGFVFFIGLASLSIWQAVRVRIRERAFKLRLLPDGLRVVDRGKTTTLRNPTIESAGRLQRIILKQGEQQIDLDLEHFAFRDQAILLEHCSQFLTTEQQAAHGAKWARRYAWLITPPKQQNLLDLWKIICIGVVISLLISPYFIEITRIHFPLGVSPWTPEICRMYIRALTVIVALAPIVFGVIWALGRLEQRFTRPHRW